ncbi:hypothetical protein [Phenylobacterium sp.]|jgi:hypothetical protein|uniref:hypothetical protein n=1 Tax=Phenylobacterium sp. TaxID=1871053 RepID=UPI002E377E08|nr:hypothetical protein [Phenylobacterium sp.]
MRIASLPILAAMTVIAFAAAAAPVPSAKEAALTAGDWHRAAELGASAADVVRALQAKGLLADIVPDESVVTIGPNNRVGVVALKPLPALPAAWSGTPVRTAGLSGSGFAFTAKPGSIILYPAYAQSFVPEGALAELQLDHGQRVP